MANDIPINKAEIRTLIPHSGTMCLLDSVIEWDDRSIVCSSNTHRDPENPLRCDGRLSAVHAFEYGAQAAAVHGGLRARSVGVTAPPGYLAALRDARLHVMRLDDVDFITSDLRASFVRRGGEYCLRMQGFSRRRSPGRRTYYHNAAHVRLSRRTASVDNHKLQTCGISSAVIDRRLQKCHITMPPSTQST